MDFSINCNGILVELTTPRVMGVLNLTPDSFYDGGRYKEQMAIVERVAAMLQQGATFIDLGGYSSRPGADHISLDTERSRVIPIVKLLVREFPGILLSVDTFRSEIARESIGSGACMINDISGGQLDDQMFRTIAELQVPYVIMHMRGTPADMQKRTQYNDLLKEVISYFSEKTFKLRNLGVNDLLIDPGYGFSKDLEQNYELLARSELLSTLNFPVLTGVSRKSMLYKLLKTGPDEALNATTAAHAVALLKGTSILRVHDVREAIETIQVVQQVKKWQGHD